MSIEAYDGLNRGVVCEVCDYHRPSASAICEKCGFDPATDGILSELLRLDQGKLVKVSFEPMSRTGEYVDRRFGDHTYRIFRVR